MRKSRKQEKKQHSPKKPFREKISSAIDMPLETLYNMTQIQILENREVVVEGCKEILEYDDNRIRLKTKRLEVSIWGGGLELKCFNAENIIISGKVERVEFNL